jgi:hypothetical protein
METKFTEQDSFAIINEMIDRARNNVQQGSANIMIYNGYSVALVAVLNFLLLYCLPEADRNSSFLVWWLMVPNTVVSRFLNRKRDRSAMVKTQIDGIIGAIWNGFTLSVVVLLTTIFATSAVFAEWSPTYLITSSIMILVGLAQFVLASACRYRPFFWSAVCFWTGALLCTLTYCLFQRGDLHFLILAACMIIGFVVPGYRLNKKAKEHV